MAKALQQTERQLLQRDTGMERIHVWLMLSNPQIRQKVAEEFLQSIKTDLSKVK